MIASLPDEQQLDFDLTATFRTAEEPERPRAAMVRAIGMSSRQRRANRARFARSRGGKASGFNGAHRRRDKRSYV